MKTNELANNPKYLFLRGRLDQMNIPHHFDYSSIDLIEQLLKIIQGYQKQSSTSNDKMKLIKEREEKQSILLSAMTYKSNEIINENKKLHQEIVALMDKCSNDTTVAQIQKFRQEIETMTFLNSQIKHNLIESSKENELLKKKYSRLINGLFDKTIDFKSIYQDDNHLQKKIVQKEAPVTLEEFEKRFEMVIDNSLTSKITISNNLIRNINEDTINKDDRLFGDEMNIPNKEQYNFTVIKNNNETDEHLKTKISMLEHNIREKEQQVDIMKNQLFTFFNCDMSNSDIITPQSVMVIDYLKNELKTSKDKYEAYIKYLLDSQKNNMSKTDQGNSRDVTKSIVEKYQNELEQKKLSINNAHKQIEQLTAEIKRKNNIIIQHSKEIKDKRLEISIDQYPLHITYYGILPKKTFKVEALQSDYRKELLYKREEIKSINHKLLIFEKENEDLKNKLSLLQSKHNKIIDDYNQMKRNLYLSNNNNDNENKLDETIQSKTLLENQLKEMTLIINDKAKIIDLILKDKAFKESEITRLNNLNLFLETQIKIYESK